MADSFAKTARRSHGLHSGLATRKKWSKSCAQVFWPSFFFGEKHPAVFVSVFLEVRHFWGQTNEAVSAKKVPHKNTGVPSGISLLFFWGAKNFPHLAPEHPRVDKHICRSWNTQGGGLRACVPRQETRSPSPFWLQKSAGFFFMDVTMRWSEKNAPKTRNFQKFPLERYESNSVSYLGTEFGGI